MARLETVAAPHRRWRVRRRSASDANDTFTPKPIRVLPAKRTDTVCDWPIEWRIALAGGVQSTKKPKGMDCEPKRPISLFAVCPVDLSKCGRDYCCVIADLF